MQVFAKDQAEQVLHAEKAERAKDYFCLECGGPVRVRGGLHRQKHFFHLQPSRWCRSSKKTLEHLQSQYWIRDRLPKGEAVLEQAFPTIRRIADVYWAERRLVFEVQCSPISAEEVLARNRDYASIGIDVIWILHEKRYGKRKMTEAEQALLGHSHYFCQINALGRGYIYDRYSLAVNALRYFFPGRRKIKVAEPFPLSLPASMKGLQAMQQRQSWRCCFEGDYGHSDLAREKLRAWERKILGNPLWARLKPTFSSIWRYLDRYVFRFYRILLRSWLEQASR